MDRVVALALSLALASTLAPVGPLAGAGAEPTPGVNLSLTRIVPEPYETNDFISLAEARAMLDALVAEVPDMVEVLDLGESYGWPNAVTGQHDRWPVFAVEVTNEASATPRGDKWAVVFQLSIHGNEKGGREGGLRVIEDLARGLGMGPDYRDLLDDVVVVFNFPNPDGWMHEEVPYRLACSGYFSLQLVAALPVVGDCVDTQSYVRTNGNGQDMNRDWPTRGWYHTGGGRLHALSEPEMHATAAYLAQFRGRTVAAADIHGMLTPADSTPGSPGPRSQACAVATGPLAGMPCPHEGHFVLGLLGFTTMDPEVNLRTVRLAERVKENLNTMAEEQFPYWTTLPNMGPLGGEFSAWGTGWDTIGYTDSGSTSRWYPEGLLAPGATYEMSYNHITFDNHYLPELNAMHVESVRAIVRGYLDEARHMVRPALAMQHGTAAWLGDPRMVEGGTAGQEGAHADSDVDDAFEGTFAVSPQRLWRDLARYLPAGSLVEVAAPQVASGDFHQHRTLVIAGDAWDLVADDAQAVEHLRMHLDQGGRLFLTDSALRGLEALGLAEAGSVEVGTAYLGHVDLDRDHALATGVRGLARQTYDGVALGHALPNDGGDATAPIWTIAGDALEPGAEVAGTSLGADRASLGRVPVGSAGGEVRFLGALLPTPTTAHYHPYGLSDYAITSTGYQLVYNALGITQDEAPWTASPAGDEELGAAEAPGRSVPGPGAATLAVAVLAGAAVSAARRSARTRDR